MRVRLIEVKIKDTETLQYWARLVNEKGTLSFGASFLFERHFVTSLSFKSFDPAFAAAEIHGIAVCRNGGSIVIKSRFSNTFIFEELNC